VLEIVERILAALIILALLTLLIILAFPVPPRDNVAPPSGTRQAERGDPAPKSEPAPAPRVEPAPAPKTAEPKSTPPAKQADPLPAPVEKKTAERLPESKGPTTVSPSEPRKPAITVREKTETERVDVRRDEIVPHRRRATYVPRREREAARRTWREPLVARECEDDDCGCCGGDCRATGRPYWAAPRRERWARLPAGVCPD
jgi:hypothetical protein